MTPPSPPPPRLPLSPPLPSRCINWWYCSRAMWEWPGGWRQSRDCSSDVTLIRVSPSRCWTTVYRGKQGLLSQCVCIASRRSSPLPAITNYNIIIMAGPRVELQPYSPTLTTIQTGQTGSEFSSNQLNTNQTVQLEEDCPSNGNIMYMYLCCFALFVCLTLLASFFFPSHLSFKHVYTHVCVLLMLLSTVQDSGPSTCT